ncbi:MAG: hypothetical protein QM482_05455 [Sulfurospirillum sp.]
MKTKLLLTTAMATTLLFAGCSTYNSNLETNSPMVSHLSDSRGMTLYTFDKDMPNKSNCYNGCEKKWPVFYGNLDKIKLPSDVSKSNFGVITRKNGMMQTTYRSKPLYYFFKDTKPSDTNGNGKKGVWHIIK